MQNQSSYNAVPGIAAFLLCRAVPGIHTSSNICQINDYINQEDRSLNGTLPYLRKEKSKYRFQWRIQHQKTINSI